MGQSEGVLKGDLVWKRAMWRAVSIVIGLWTLFMAAASLIGIPSAFVPMPDVVEDIILGWLEATPVVALVGVGGLFGGWRIGHHATLIALTMNTAYLLALPLVDAEMDIRRAYPTLGTVVLVNIFAAMALRTISRRLSRP